MSGETRTSHRTGTVSELQDHSGQEPASWFFYPVTTVVHIRRSDRSDLVQNGPMFRHLGFPGIVPDKSVRIAESFIGQSVSFFNKSIVNLSISL